MASEKYELLCGVAVEMYKCLLMAPSSWEDETHHIKHFRDALVELGAIRKDERIYEKEADR